MSILLMHEDAKPGNIVRGFLLTCKFAVSSIKSGTEHIEIEYESESGNTETYFLDNGTITTIKNGYLCWDVDCESRGTIQRFALRFN